MEVGKEGGGRVGWLCRRRSERGRRAMAGGYFWDMVLASGAALRPPLSGPINSVLPPTIRSSSPLLSPSPFSLLFIPPKVDIDVLNV